MNWRERIENSGFADYRLTEMPSFRIWRRTIDARGIAPHVHEPEEPYSAALVLLYPYRLYQNPPAGTPVISAFYPASNQAYHRARDLSIAFQEEGIACRHATEIPYKPVAQKSGVSLYGTNCLQHHERYGSLFALEVICFYGDPTLVSEKLGLEIFRLEEPEEEQMLPVCSRCQSCRENCPTSALTGEGIEIMRCLRFHMMKTVENTQIRIRMGLRLLGCDSCNSSCIQNRVLPRQDYPGELAELFTFENLLDEKKLRMLLPEMGTWIGTNYARVNSLLRQAALIAGNSQDDSLIPLLRKLAEHTDEVVAEHAAWSICRLEKDR